MENALGFSAIGWVHYRIAGGLKQIVIVSAVYAGILIALAGFMARVLDPVRFGVTVYAQEARLVLILQGFVLLIFGVYRVAASIRLDLMTNMIESHRLMPVHPAHAILGYMIGATAQTWALALVNLVVSLGLVIKGGEAPGPLLLSHAIIAGFALFVWTLTAMCALIARVFIGGLTVVPMVFLFTQGVLLLVLPGLNLMISPALGNTAFALSGTVTAAHYVSFIAQAAAGAVFFLSAARRYRQPDKPAIRPLLGLTLLAVWVGVSLIGMHGIEGADSLLLRATHSRPSPYAQIIGSSIVTMLLMIVPLANSAWHLVDDRRHRPHAAGTSELRAWGILVAAVVLALLLTRGVRETGGYFELVYEDAARLAVMAMAVIGFALAVHFLLRIVYRGGGQRGALLVFLWIVVFWVLPLIADFVRNIIDRDSDFRLSISSVSPIGTTAIAYGPWFRDPASPSPIWGAAVQLVLGLAMVVLYYGTTRPTAQASAMEKPLP